MSKKIRATQGKSVKHTMCDDGSIESILSYKGHVEVIVSRNEADARMREDLFRYFGFQSAITRKAILSEVAAKENA